MLFVGVIDMCKRAQQTVLRDLAEGGALLQESARCKKHSKVVRIDISRLSG